MYVGTYRTCSYTVLSFTETLVPMHWDDSKTRCDCDVSYLIHNYRKFSSRNNES